MCVVVDQHALDTIRTIRNRVTASGCPVNLHSMEDTAQIVEDDAVAFTLQFLKNRSGIDTLSYALSRTSEVWKPMNLLNKQERQQLGSTSNGGIILKPDNKADRFIRIVVHETYERHKRLGLLESDFPYLRFSARLDQLETRTAVDRCSVPTLRPKRPLPRIPLDSAILVCNQDRNKMHLCVYTTYIHRHPPGFTEIFNALTTAIDRDQFFILGRGHWDKENRDLVVEARVQPEEFSNFTISTAARHWRLSMCYRFSEEAFRSQISKEAVAHGLTELEKLCNMKQVSQVLNSPRPFLIGQSMFFQAKRPCQDQVGL